MSETKLKIQSYGTQFNAPEGYLLNGKIVPSVASNNLTVALKTLDGNDATASNPIIIRIGDTVHSITSALSVTKNAGTNWFNAGSAELATKEIDYFVYLGYNATDGVVIGFSRIPYGTQYDQFSATSNNEKYCAISTITNAASGDDYTVIGRFAATLSAGTGYTWTVPTFTSVNLIQRPIFETRFLVWSPTVTGGSNVTTANIFYSLSNYSCKLVWLHIGCTSNANTFTFTVPFTVGSNFYTHGFPVFVQNNGSNVAQVGHISFTPTSNIVGAFLSFYQGVWATSNSKAVYGNSVEYNII